MAVCSWSKKLSVPPVLGVFSIPSALSWLHHSFVFNNRILKTHCVDGPCQTPGEGTKRIQEICSHGAEYMAEARRGDTHKLSVDKMKRVTFREGKSSSMERPGKISEKEVGWELHLEGYVGFGQNGEGPGAPCASLRALLSKCSICSLPPWVMCKST